MAEEEVCAIVKERETRVIRFPCSRRNSIIKIEFRNWIHPTHPNNEDRPPISIRLYPKFALNFHFFFRNFLIRDFLVPTNRSQSTLRLRLIDRESRNAIKCWRKSSFAKFKFNLFFTTIVPYLIHPRPSEVYNIRQEKKRNWIINKIAIMSTPYQIHFVY